LRSDYWDGGGALIAMGRTIPLFRIVLEIEKEELD
jgi:hypothetical protein